MKRNTACECEQSGWCSRHQVDKNLQEFRLCQFVPKHFEQWENGLGLGQPGAERSRNQSNSVSRRYADCELTTAVVIVCHNYGEFLAECIESVLSQTRAANEVIVIDDASTDQTPEIARQYENSSVKYQYVEYQNVHQARKSGYEFTESQIICFLDADDILSPDYLEQGLLKFSNYRVGVVYSDCQLFGKRTDYLEYPAIFDAGQLERDNFIHAGSLVRRDAISLSGVFTKEIDPLYTQGDWFIWRHVLRVGWQAVKQHSVYHYRQHDRNWMQSMRRDRNNYFKYAGLEHELVTLCVALSGRKESWQELKKFMERQCWPHDQIQLILLDTSQDENFAKMVRNWLIESDYQHITYNALEVGPPKLAELDRHDHAVKTAVRQAMARIYNHFSRLVTTEYVWFLEDDVIPPNDVCERLLTAFDRNTASVAAPYHSRYQDAYCVWVNIFQNLSDLGSGVQKVGGNGFGCTLIRGSVLKQSLFTAEGVSADFDIAFYSRLKDLKLEARVDWDCEAIHLGAETPSNVGKWNSLFNSESRPFGDDFTYHRAAQFLSDCEQIEDWGSGLAWFSKIFPEHGAGQVTNIDGTESAYSHQVADLCEFRSSSEGILLRHVLEHDFRWKTILLNALQSTVRKLVVVTYTPFGESTRNIETHRFPDGGEVPVLSFRLEDLFRVFNQYPQFTVDEESVLTNTEFRNERLLYLTRKSGSSF